MSDMFGDVQRMNKRQVIKIEKYVSNLQYALQ